MLLFHNILHAKIVILLLKPNKIDFFLRIFGNGYFTEIIMHFYITIVVWILSLKSHNRLRRKLTVRNIIYSVFYFQFFSSFVCVN